jgi:Flp pilus assembly protein TadG
MGTLVSRQPCRRTADHRGQSLAEFALVLPILLLVIGGIIQFGIIFWGQNTLNQVVRDTGRWAATQTQCSSTGPIVVTADAIAAQSSLIGFTGTFPSGDVAVSWTGTPCPPNDNQNVAWVNITIDHTVPIFFPWVPGNGSITSTTEFRMEPAAQ